MAEAQANGANGAASAPGGYVPRLRKHYDEVVRPKLVEEFDSGMDVNTIRTKFAENTELGDLNYMITWTGAGVGEMHEVKGAKVRPLKTRHIIVFFFFYCVRCQAEIFVMSPGYRI